MMRGRKPFIDAGVCREIARELIEKHGPLTVSQIYGQIRKVFKLNSSFLVTNLTKKNGEFIIDNGLVHIKFTRPVQSVGRKGKK